MTEHELRELLAEYLTLLQRHPSAEEMMEAILTDDFETGFEGGFSWKGIEGLRDFLSQRERFFDEQHQIKDVLELDERPEGEVHARTRLEFFPALGAAVPDQRRVHRRLLPPLARTPGARSLARSRSDRRALRRPQRQRRAPLRDTRRGAQPLRAAIVGAGLAG